MKKKERIKETIFCIVVAVIVTGLYIAAGAMQRGWVDLPGAAALLVLIAPLTFFWILHRTTGEEEEKE